MDKSKEKRDDKRSKPNKNNNLDPKKKEKKVKTQTEIKHEIEGKKYERQAPPSSATQTQNRKLSSKIRNASKQKKLMIKQAVQAELLLPSEAGFIEPESKLEKTWQINQNTITEAVDLQTAAKRFELNLPEGGPYSLDFSPNGRHLLLGGNKGHVAVVEWSKFHLQSELKLGETVRDAIFLHDHTFYAAAQQKFLYIYDSNSGAEVHCMRNHFEPTRLAFLKYHFLLVSINTGGVLRYQDTSTGSVAVERYTGLGSCSTMALNPWNAIIHLGHPNGTVTLWSPNVGKPLVKMLCHRGGIASMAIDRSGKFLVTGGVDGFTKIWDLRTYTEVQSYKKREVPSVLTISDRGLLAIGSGRNVEIWKDVFQSAKQEEPYMKHKAKSEIERMKFIPFEDLLGISQRIGFETMIVPGSAEPNFDSFEANPYQTGRQRAEQEVHALIEKLPAETIALNPTDIGKVKPSTVRVLRERRQLSAAANKRKLSQKKNKLTKKILRKDKFARKQLKRQSRGVERVQREKSKIEKKFDSALDQALSRFE
eukprot:c16023_g1_i1.p1 GENE.c16023_g1_i1~~c16023_g1_i1.p1  ORF type:complete len:536 (+),score=212.63 c16023_g1_i1:19-1626(+)